MDAQIREAALLNFYRAERRAGTDPLLANERMSEYAKRLDCLQDNMSEAEFDRRLAQIATVALGVE